jgi:hypothetical protein
MPSADPQRDWVQLARGWSRVLCLAVLAIGLVELFAWLARPAWMHADSPFYWMKANGAAGVVLIAAATWLSLGAAGGWRRTVAAGFAVGVLLLGLATLVEYVTTWSPGFDVWLGADPTVDAGRMAAQSAANLSLFALSILTFASAAGPKSWLCDSSLLAAGLILEVMVAGYFDHAQLLYDVTGQSMAAPQSAVAQMLLGGALAFGRTGRGAFTIFAGRGAGSAAMRVLMLVVVVLPVGLGRLRQLGEDLGWVSASGSYAHAVFAVTQTVMLGLTVYVFARHVNRLDERYRVERKRREEFERYVAVCAWTRRIRWEGRWISIEEFLQKRFGLEVTHGISDEALAEQLASLVPREALEGDKERSDT